MEEQRGTSTTGLTSLDEMEAADGRAMRQKGTHQTERQGV